LLAAGWFAGISSSISDSSGTRAKVSLGHVVK
jgi:hypothetical protein